MIVTIMEINALFLMMLKINSACIVGDSDENSAVFLRAFYLLQKLFYVISFTHRLL